MWFYRLPKFEAIRGVTLGILPLLVIFLNFLGKGEKCFRPNLILDKYQKLCFLKVFFNLKPIEV